MQYQFNYMRHYMYTLLFFGTLWMMPSCKTVQGENGTSTKQLPPTAYTISIRIKNNGNLLNQVMVKVYQYVNPVGVLFNMDNVSVLQETEIQVKTLALSDTQINGLKSSLYSLSGNIMMSVTKN